MKPQLVADRVKYTLAVDGLCPCASLYMAWVPRRSLARTANTDTATASRTHTLTNHQYQHRGMHIGHTPVHCFEADRIDFKQDCLNTKSQTVADTPKRHSWYMGCTPGQTYIYMV